MNNKPVTVILGRYNKHTITAYIKGYDNLYSCKEFSIKEVAECQLDIGDSFQWIPGPKLTLESIIHHPRKFSEGEYEEIMKEWDK